jgi:hypothetical protein
MIAKNQLEKILSENLTQKVSIENINFNPILLSFEIEGFKIYNQKATTISFDSLYIDFFLIKSLDEKHISFKTVDITNLFLDVIEDKKGTFNILKLLKPTQTSKKDENANKNDIKFQIYKTSLNNVKIKYTKLFEDKKPLIIDINPLNYTLYDLGTYKNELASHSLNLKINNKTTLKIDGGLRLVPFEMYGKVDIKKFHPTQFLPYKDENLNFDLNKDSFVNLSFGYNVDTKKDLKIELNKLFLDLNNLKISQKNDELITLYKFNISDFNYSYPQNSFKIDSINFDKLYTKLVVDKSSKLNLTTLIKTSTQENKKEQTDAKNTNIEGSLNKINITNSNIDFKDLSSLLDLKVNNINIKLDNSKIKNNKIQISSYENRSDISLIDSKNGLDLNLDNLVINMNNLSSIEQSLLVDKIKIQTPNISFLNKNANTKIESKNVDFNINSISYDNNKLKIVSSNINKPLIDVYLNKSEKEIKKEKVETSTKTTSTNKSDFSFEIGPVKIIEGKMKFEDKNLAVPFKTQISELNGEFSNINSTNDKPTKLNLEGKVDKYGYSKISGIVAINDIKLLTDTNILFKNIAIKNFTPYSGKFIGRELDSGKLNLDLKYNIKKSNLNAKNSIIISDIKLGKNIESPDATKLPLELAIALLEDSKGVININLPVSGNIDDPKFSLAPIIWKGFINLIFKAVASPFSILGSIFNFDKEKLKAIQFEYGKSTILPSEKESLDILAKILKQKQKLAIKIEPVYDFKKDKLALQKFVLDEKIKPQADTKEYLSKLENLYIQQISPSLSNEKEKFSQKNNIGEKVFNEEAYLEFLQNSLASKIEIKDENVNKLINERIENIKNYLIKEKNLSTDSLKIEKEKEIESKNKKWLDFKIYVTTK